MDNYGNENEALNTIEEELDSLKIEEEILSSDKEKEQTKASVLYNPQEIQDIYMQYLAASKANKPRLEATLYRKLDGVITAVVRTNNTIFVRYSNWCNYNYHSTKEPIHDDIVQEGRLATYKAIQKYDFQQGTLLCSWVYTALLRHFYAFFSSQLGLSSSDSSRYFYVIQHLYTHWFSCGFTEQPDANRIYNRLKLQGKGERITLAIVQECIEVIKQGGKAISLNDAITSHSGKNDSSDAYTYEDRIGDKREPDIVHSYESSTGYKLLYEVISTELTELEQICIVLRYGIYDLDIAPYLRKNQYLTRLRMICNKANLTSIYSMGSLDGEKDTSSYTDIKQIPVATIAAALNQQRGSVNYAIESALHKLQRSARLLSFYGDDNLPFKNNSLFNLDDYVNDFSEDIIKNDIDLFDELSPEELADYSAQNPAIQRVASFVSCFE